MLMGAKRGWILAGGLLLLLGVAVLLGLHNNSLREPPPSAVVGMQAAPEDAGEVDLAEPFPDAPDRGTPGPFQLQLADGSRVLGGYSHRGREGEWIRLSSSGGLLVRGTYSDGVLEGEWLSYYRTTGGIRETGTYGDGVAVGTWTMNYPQGTLFESVEFQEGSPHGRWTMHHPDGSLADEMTWASGQQVGLETNYEPDGRVVALGSFERHRPSGEWVCFGPTGTKRVIPAPAERLTPRQACGFGRGPEEPDALPVPD
jgi:hypothetical protein